MNFLDTSSLLHSSDLNSLSPFVVCDITLAELENIKTSSTKDAETKFKSRQVARWLDKHRSDFSVVYYSNKYDDILYSHNLSLTNDNKIIVTAYFYNKDNNVILYSEDILFKITAYSFFNLDVRSLSDINRETYKGYIKFSGTSEEINGFMDSLDLSKWYVNQYLILENTDYNTTSEMRYDGEKFVPLKLPVSSFII